jgi:3'-phosphoadenosine 5'-phosphosulfate sulfotransferase (PAPS reductase)/FAD synthetase
MMMRTALQFSGGKDSLALLYHLEALWPFIDVVTLDTGDLTQAAQMNVEVARKVVPNFRLIATDSRAYRAAAGEPTSADWTACCAANIWMPMLSFLKQNGYRQVMRGTKAVDPYLHAVFPGDVVDGVLFTMPLWHWSDEDVKAYLKDRLPQPYVLGAHGMPDCVSCPVPEACGGKTRRMWQ